ncbi:MAG TPA: thermonuclease family protein [Reyranella sp.]|nr:thermonuclease family protein [Reyranella sp.]
MLLYHRSMHGKTIWKVAAAGLAVLLRCDGALAQIVEDGSGVPHGFAVASGDTVKFGRQAVHLYGIAAPARGELCDDGGWNPAPLSAKALVDFIAGRPVSCRQVEVERKDGRPLALCFAGADDLQALMVGAGWAWANSQSGGQYVDAERRAAARGVGVHGHRCRPPGERRRVPDDSSR